jgi:hypothetical protein
MHGHDAIKSGLYTGGRQLPSFVFESQMLKPLMLKTLMLNTLMLKTIILPRQARDKHRKS